MNVINQFRRLFADPPPEFVFEISPRGIAFARRVNSGRELGFQPLDEGVLAITPLKDNVLQPDVLFSEVRALAPQNGKTRGRTAALILPDFCARVTVLEFADFPTRVEEQEALVRFRIKKSIAFDLESAKVSYYVQSSTGKQREVVVSAAALEIVARYEAAFRSAGFKPGQVTTSSMAALGLLNSDGLGILAKLSGNVLAVTVTERDRLRLLRCVELPDVTPEEVSAVLYPTFAFVEDELGAKPVELELCGFGAMNTVVAEQCQADLGVSVLPLRSKYGNPDETNAGLLGHLEGSGD